MIARAAVGVLLAAAMAAVARAARSLSTSGALAATFVGTLAIAAGWTWAMLLIAYFAASTALSRFGRPQKERRTTSIVAKGDERDALQVTANGAVFALAAALSLFSPAAPWLALGAGALAASAADTWATELGTLYGAAPRSIISWRVVPTGTSGAVSAIGSLGACAGAVFVAAIAWLLGWRSAAFPAALGGIAGTLADSLLGATLQTRRWCDACGCATERATHDCGAATRLIRGPAWLDNDMVNLLSGAIGGLVALAIAR